MVLLVHDGKIPDVSLRFERKLGVCEYLTCNWKYLFLLIEFSIIARYLQRCEAVTSLVS